MPHEMKKSAPIGAKGHRDRMRNAFFNNVEMSFTDYRLLEILLYSNFLRCDTRDVAYCLVKRFGSLAGVFRAETSELKKVNNVGNSCASFIKTIGKLYERLDNREATEPICFNSSRELGELFLFNTRALASGQICVGAFTSDGVLLRIGEIVPTLKAVCEFIHITATQTIAIGVRARDGELLPSFEINSFICVLRPFLELLDVGFCGCFCCASNDFAVIDEDFPPIENYTAAHESSEGNYRTCINNANSLPDIHDRDKFSTEIADIQKQLLTNNAAMSADRSVLMAILYLHLRDYSAESCASSLIDRFGTIPAILGADIHELISVYGINRSCAVYIKAINALKSMIANPPEPGGTVYRSSDGIAQLFAKKFADLKSESILLAAFNKSRRLISTRRFDSNSSEDCSVSWRAVAEFVGITGAYSLAVAHNHMSELTVTQEDRFFTIELSHFLHSIDVVFLGHFLCSGDAFYLIDGEP